MTIAVISSGIPFSKVNVILYVPSFKLYTSGPISNLVSYIRIFHFPIIFGLKSDALDELIETACPSISNLTMLFVNTSSENER